MSPASNGGTAFLSDPDVTIWNGDALEVLRQLPDESADCCVTSPPYWGLRDYGHGAQIGLEQTPAGYVAALVSVFAELRRVLSRKGTLWLNLGDSYSHGGNGSRDPEKWPKQSRNDHRVEHAKTAGGKPKDLLGMPWRVAFALQDDGWYLRSAITWCKPNPMPESVTDRPTKSTEMVFLLSKQPSYYFGQEDLREPYSPATLERDQYGYGHAFANQFKGSPTDQRHPNGKQLPPGSFASGPDGRHKTTIEPGPGTHGHHQTGERERWPNADGRNIRDHWIIATQPYPEAHFAVFPQELARRMILGGCPPGGTVLDPFGGSGTTALVARRLERKAVLIELNPDYCDMAARRLAQQSLLAEALERGL